MIKRLILTLLALAIVFGAIFGWKIRKEAQTRQFMASQKPPPVSVSAKAAEKSIWQPAINAVGSLVAVQGVDVTGEVPGMIIRIHFSSGQRVAKGSPLVSLDTRAEEAELSRLEAARELADIQMKRQRELVQKKMAPQSALDEALAEYRQIKASIENQTVLIDKKTIKAPFDGILGIRQVDVGQYFAPGQAVVTLQDLDPIYADFTLPQQRLNEVAVGQTITFALDVWPDKAFEGEIMAIDPKIDSGSRNFRLRATLDNPDQLLRPGMFGQVELAVADPVSRITLPQTAVSHHPYGDIVFVLQGPGGDTADDQQQKVYTASRRFIVTGETRGDQIAVTEGIEEGEMVVIAGSHKLKEGSRATINNGVIPSNNPSPNLENY